MRAARQRARCSSRDLARQEPAADPGRATSAARAPPGRGADRRRLARSRASSSSAATRSTSTTCSPAPCGCWPSTRTGSRATAQRWRWLLVDEYPGHQRGPEPSSSPCSPAPAATLTCVGDDDQLDLPLARRRAAQHPRLRRALPRPRARSCSAATSAAARRSSTPPSRASRTTSARTAKALIAMRGAGGRVARARLRHPTRARRDWVAGLIADALAAGTSPERDPRARPHRVRHRAGAARARRTPGSRTACSARSGLYERAEVRDALAYLTLLANPRDAQAFRRAIGAPRRGVGSATAEPRRRARPRRTRRRPDRRLRARRTQLDGIRAQRSATGSRGSAPASTRIRARARARPLARPRRRRDGDARRRPRRATTSSAATAPQRPTSAATPSACSRTCARCAAPPRPTSDQHGDRATLDRLPRARRRPARPGDPTPASRTGGSPSRRSTAPRAPRRRLVVLLGCEEQLLPSWRSLAEPRPRAARRGAPAVLRRRHPRQGPARDHARRHAAAGRADRRPVALPRRSRASTRGERPLAA